MYSVRKYEGSELAKYKKECKDDGPCTLYLSDPGMIQLARVER